MRVPSGLVLGIGTSIVSTALDRETTKPPPSELIIEAFNLSLINLLLIGPLVHRRALMWTRPRHCVRKLFDIFAIVTIHSGLYTLAHRCMHKLACLRGIHRDHHKFTHTIMPSTANAVSFQEFLFAYMLPFYVSVVVLKPDGASLDAAVATVSLFNLFVHSPHLQSWKWPSCLVTPNEHQNHHKFKSPHYSAPTWSWRWLSNIVKR